jgi:hypothetical protein
MRSIEIAPGRTRTWSRDGTRAAEGETKRSAFACFCTQK